jgi:alpha-L-rhamnosidase
MAALGAARLRCEYLVDPLGIDAREPRLTWELAGTTTESIAQDAYEVEVASSRDRLQAGDADRWSSGVVNSSDAQCVYGGPPLLSREEAHWRVRLHTGGTVSDWSEPARWEAGLLDPSDWQSEWITMPPVPFARDQYRPAAHFRRGFDLAGKPVRARLYATALGLYRARINGQEVTDDLLRPGWTDYTQRVQYQTYDVTGLLDSGENAIGLVLGEGWYSGHFGVDPRRTNWGEHPQLMAQLILDFEDGVSTTIATDTSWQSAFGAILAADLLQGESYDARQEQPGWDAPGFDATGWTAAILAERPAIELIAPRGEPVRRVSEITAVSVSEPVFSTYVFDFGQNLVGWVRLKVDGPAGAEVVLRHGEALHPDGTVYTANLRAATSTDRYVLRGEGEAVWEPSFTLHGFRYVEVTGFPGVPDADAITAIVVASDLAEAGSFECSNDLVNRLHANIVWSVRGNFVEVPTDCPQRNERFGWLGDARVISRTATAMFDTAAFFTKWMDDVRLARSPDGIYSDFAPWVGPMAEGGPGWSDAGVFIPWLMYERFGDTAILADHFEAMAQFIDVITKENPDLIRVNRNGMNWGDWLSLPESDPDQGRGSGPIIDSVHSTTPKDLFATAFFARSTELVSRAAAVLGRADDHHRYAQHAADIRAAWNERFVGPDGRIHGDTQTAYALALCFDLVPDEIRPAVGSHLAAAVERAGHMTTGITGTEMLLPALTDAGRLDLAYQLLLNEDYPSWGYTIRNGATTIWERWDGWTDERGFQDIRMNSFNHYALGAVGAWLYETVGGLALDRTRPGENHFIVSPRPGGGITSAKVEQSATTGRAKVAWELSDEGVLALEVTIPPGATATVAVPDVVEIGPGHHRFEGRVPAAS